MVGVVTRLFWNGFAQIGFGLGNRRLIGEVGFLVRGWLFYLCFFAVFVTDTGHGRRFCGRSMVCAWRR